MAKLTGTNPDQVPTNADLGTMAYQDKDNLQVGNVEAKGTINFTDKVGVDRLHISGGGGGAIINNNDNSGIRFQYTGTELVRIESNGDVGIGTASPAHKLDVAGEMIADSYNETYAAVTSSSNATTVNCESGNTFSHTLTENTTFTFSNPPASGTSYTFSIEIIQDASASGFAVTWASSVDWPAATAPTLTATASAKDIFVFTTRDGGTTWYGFTAGQALA